MIGHIKGSAPPFSLSVYHLCIWFVHVYLAGFNIHAPQSWECRAAPREPGSTGPSKAANDRITRRVWRGSEVSSFPLMARRRKWIMGVDKGDNGLLYVCLKAWPNKERPSLSTGNWKLKCNMKRVTLTSVTLYGVANLGSEWFSILGICKVEDVTGRNVWILQNSVNQVQWKAGTQRVFWPSRERHSRKTQWTSHQWALASMVISPKQK